MRRFTVLALASGTLLWLCLGCVQAPREINIGTSRDRPEPVDSSRVPRTSSHDDCRYELQKAYDNLRYIERENARLKDKAAEYKRERDDARHERERYEDELDRCRDRLEDLRERD